MRGGSIRSDGPQFLVSVSMRGESTPTPESAARGKLERKVVTSKPKFAAATFAGALECPAAQRQICDGMLDAPGRG